MWKLTDKNLKNLPYRGRPLMLAAIAAGGKSSWLNIKMSVQM